jgi:hypothetical protein
LVSLNFPLILFELPLIDFIYHDKFFTSSELFQVPVSFSTTCVDRHYLPFRIGISVNSWAYQWYFQNLKNRRILSRYTMKVQLPLEKTMPETCYCDLLILSQQTS